MYDRFTEEARQVIVLSQEEARGLGHGHIGTEHLLLGLIGEGAGPASRAFVKLDVTADAARAQVVADVPPSAESPGSRQLPFTPRAKGTLEGALRQAIGLGHAHIGTEHLLLALLIERDARTARILSSLGCPPDLLRDTLVGGDARTRPDDDGDALLALAAAGGIAADALAELGITREALATAVERARGAS